ncbi:MAG: hypothetical protein FWD30_02025 [Dehalococcoidia bacterium]|nr:hypothetical protein [Dehalococcoidia bacterium]
MKMVLGLDEWLYATTLKRKYPVLLSSSVVNGSTVVFEILRDSDLARRENSGFASQIVIPR